MQKMSPGVKKVVLWLGLIWAMPVACSLRTDHATYASGPTVSIERHATADVRGATERIGNRG